jgi:hypothetical protein
MSPNLIAIIWLILGVAVALLWVLAVDWCVVGIIREWRRRKALIRLAAILNGQKHGQ